MRYEDVSNSGFASDASGAAFAIFYRIIYISAVAPGDAASSARVTPKDTTKGFEETFTITTHSVFLD